MRIYFEIRRKSFQAMLRYRFFKIHFKPQKWSLCAIWIYGKFSLTLNANVHNARAATGTQSGINEYILMILVGFKRSGSCLVVNMWCNDLNMMLNLYAYGMLALQVAVRLFKHN